MPRNKDGHYYYGFYPTIYRSDTTHLSLAEDGAYRRLIDEYRIGRAPLPADDRSLARILGVGIEEWLAVKQEVLKFFYLSENQEESQPVIPGMGLSKLRPILRHKFCDKEIQDENQRIKTGKNNGKKGGRPSNNSLKNQSHKPDGNLTETQKKPNQIKSNQKKSNKESDSGAARQDFSNSFERGFDIEFILKDRTRDEARAASNGWDLYVLMRTFNELVNSGKFQRPDRPDSAFLAWVKAFTKGKPP